MCCVWGRHKVASGCSSHCLGIFYVLLIVFIMKTFGSSSASLASPHDVAALNVGEIFLKFAFAFRVAVGIMLGWNPVAFRHVLVCYVIQRMVSMVL